MFIILGATGHVGSAVASELLKQNEPVTVVLHSPNKDQEWKDKKANTVIADINDVDAMRTIFRTSKRAFVLNPPAPPSSDTVTVEKKSVSSILSALKGSGIEKVVAESTYGAQAGDGIGDLGVLYELEQGLVQQQSPATIIRAAYYMSNWAASLESAKKEGIVHTLYPVDFKLPMVAPKDIASFAARFLKEPATQTSLEYVEGPEEYSSADVAAAFATILSKPVKAVETPPDQWLQALQTMGFSKKAAVSMASMTKIILNKQYTRLDKPNRGATTLFDYIHSLMN